MIFETIVQAVGLHNKGPDERLRYYQARPPATWAIIQTTLPEEFKKQRDDWSNLLLRKHRDDLRAQLSGVITSQAMMPVAM